MRVSDVEPSPEPYLWCPFIPREELTIVEGDPGTGKSYMLMAVCAWISRGLALPGQQKLPPLNSIYLGTEDPPRRLRARLEGMGANLSRVVALPDDGWDWTVKQPDVLKALIRKIDASLVVIDPTMDFWPDGVDTYRQEDVRPLMSGLVKVARDTGSAIAVVRHFTKSQDTQAQYKGSGSVGFAARARSVIAVKSFGAYEQRMYAAYEQIKTNVVAPGTTQYFSVGSRGWEWHEELPEALSVGMKEKKLWGRLGKLMFALQQSPDGTLTKDDARAATGWINEKTFRNRVSEGQKLGAIYVKGDTIGLAGHAKDGASE